jgi:LCP family protein required for cell wall assembly
MGAVHDRVVESPAVNLDPLDETRPHRGRQDEARNGGPSESAPRARRRGGCLSIVVPGILLGILLSVYFLAPFRTNILLLGLDRAPSGSDASRTDTMVLTTIIPTRPYVGMLSIPRDLWVSIPGEGENRINAAHFLAEAEHPGSGPEAAMDVVRANFGVDVHGYVRLRFDGLEKFVNALGGVEVDLPEPMSGYEAGKHVLDGTHALAFVRDRAGSDDFARMARGQLFLKSVLKSMARPLTWPRVPLAIPALLGSIDTDIPVWLWPRLGLAIVRAGPGGIDARVISREMTHGFTTQGGAQVLAPDWSKINPVLLEMFGQ